MHAAVRLQMVMNSVMETNPKTWVIVGASRGIGLELVKQLLERGEQVVAAVRKLSAAPKLFDLVESQKAQDRCTVEQCDIASDESISKFVGKISDAVNNKRMTLGNVVLNAGVLQYPNRATELSFADFALHLHTNTIGPIICAQKLLNISIDAPPPRIIFISSDSGSASQFLEFEDGFGAYAASKSALNQMIRHMAAELGRSEQRKRETVVLALHPGEVATDMADIQLSWEVKGSISPAESVAGMLGVIAEKGEAGTGTFWCWNGMRLIHPSVPTDSEKSLDNVILFAKWSHPVDPGEDYVEPPWIFPEGIDLDTLAAWTAQAAEAESRAVRSTPCYRLSSTATDPSHGGRGARSLLLQWGIRQSNKSGSPLYLGSTEEAAAFYKKNGLIACEVISLPIRIDGNSETQIYKEIVFTYHPTVE